jgi:hypothetical protein
MSSRSIYTEDKRVRSEIFQTTSGTYFEFIQTLSANYYVLCQIVHQNTGYTKLTDDDNNEIDLFMEEMVLKYEI